MASPTVRIFSASLSEISEPNSSSKAITSSTVSKLSAPRSSIKFASSVTLVLQHLNDQLPFFLLCLQHLLSFVNSLILIY